MPSFTDEYLGLSEASWSWEHQIIGGNFSRYNPPANLLSIAERYKLHLCWQAHCFQNIIGRNGEFEDVDGFQAWGIAYFSDFI